MFNRFSLSLALASAMALMACQAPMGSVTVQLRPVLDAPARRVLDLAGYTAADIDHLELRLYRVADASETSVGEAEVPGTALGSTVNFGNLRPNSAYRVRAFAFRDAAEETLISDADLSQADFLVGQDDVASPVTIPVKLSKQTTIVSGTSGSTSLTIVPGVYLTPTPLPTATPTSTPTTTISATFKWLEYPEAFGYHEIAVEDLTGGLFSQDQKVPINNSTYLFTMPTFSLPYSSSHTFRIWWPNSYTTTYKQQMNDCLVGDLTATVDAGGAVSWTYQEYTGNAYTDTLVLQ